AGLAKATADIRCHLSRICLIVYTSENGVAGVGRADVVEESGDVSALLVDGDHRERVRLEDGRGELLQLREGLDVVAEKADAGHPPAQAGGDPLGQGRADE